MDSVLLPVHNSNWKIVVKETDLGRRVVRMPTAVQDLLPTQLDLKPYRQYDTNIGVYKIVCNYHTFPYHTLDWDTTNKKIAATFISG